MDLQSPIESRSGDRLIPLTAGQLRLWQQCISQDPPASLRTCAAAYRLKGQFDTALLRRCLQLLLERHESLRTRIVTVDGAPLQQIDAAAEAALWVTDLSDLSVGEAERQAE